MGEWPIGSGQLAAGELTGEVGDQQRLPGEDRRPVDGQQGVPTAQGAAVDVGALRRRAGAGPFGYVIEAGKLGVLVLVLLGSRPPLLLRGLVCPGRVGLPGQGQPQGAPDRPAHPGDGERDGQDGQDGRVRVMVGVPNDHAHRVQHEGQRQERLGYPAQRAPPGPFGPDMAVALRAWLGTVTAPGGEKLFDAAALGAVFGDLEPHTQNGQVCRIVVDDAVAAGDVATMIRDGVGIDRSTGSAAAGVLYQHEVVPPGTRFGLRITATQTKIDAERVGFALDLLVQALAGGRVEIGAARTRGLGQARLTGVTRTRTDSVKGVLRFHAERIVRTLTSREVPADWLDQVNDPRLGPVTALFGTAGGHRRRERDRRVAGSEAAGERAGETPQGRPGPQGAGV